MVMEALSVVYQSHEVGALSFDAEKGTSAFQYTPAFVNSGIELSPIHMPLSDRIYSFPGLDYDAFKGLPGLLADSLPDDFGNAVLNAWVASRGESATDITPLQRLKYTGKRGMGALVFRPATQMKSLNTSHEVEIASLVKIAQEVLDNRESFQIDLPPDGQEDKQAMLSLLSVGMSAGGARPKAVLAFNDDFTRVRSGQVDVPDGFEHYIVKFDGVTEHRSTRETFGDPLGYSIMEYVYSKMAGSCGIDMMPCGLLDEGPRRHFMTKRFDRAENRRIHFQSLNGLAHVSYKKPGEYSYAELFGVARALKLPARSAEQLFRRMVFNVVARNHDDHSKNFAFAFDEEEGWYLAPAYDVAFSFKPGSKWVNSHWMTINGKRDGFEREDFYAFQSLSSLFSKRKIDQILDEVISSVARWPNLAREHGVPGDFADFITGSLRLSL
jgi:serine/threonine-protein kinase HipA